MSLTSKLIRYLVPDIKKKGREGWSDCIVKRGGLAHRLHTFTDTQGESPYPLSYNLSITVSRFSEFFMYLLEGIV